MAMELFESPVLMSLNYQQRGYNPSHFSPSLKAFLSFHSSSSSTSTSAYGCCTRSGSSIIISRRLAVTASSSPSTASTIPQDPASPPHVLGNVVVVGAGPAGCLMAHYLIRRGFFVHLFERRLALPTCKMNADNKNEQLYVRGDTRSYTMLLTSRAMKALEGADIQLPHSLLGSLVGSCVHLSEGKMRKFDYSSDPDLQSYGVSRNAFVAYLQQTLFERDTDHLSTNFGWELKEIDDTNRLATFQRSANYIDDCLQQQHEMKVEFDLLVGADGVSSKVRAELLRLDAIQRAAGNATENLPLSLKFLQNPEFYKSFHIRPALAKTSPLYKDHNRVQSWPSLNMLLVGMADGSFWGGSKKADLLNASSASEVETLFKGNAPEVYDLLLKENPNFAEDFLKQPAISFGGAVLLSRFHHKNVLLIGDAAHSMFPSYGTGCNVALEDCLLFDQILQESKPVHGKFPLRPAAAEFTRRRLCDAHAIVEMNTNFMLFPRGFLGYLQMLFLTTLRKWFPAVIKPTSYQLLWSTVPFEKIRHQKHKEIFLFYTALLLTSTLVVLIALSILQVLH
ncbi:hypothetical protein O6H91_04G026400 [Diphasiastrum complanatum]|uniref:Uncharacterized protein n=1 Tax=Diphasiastrum complanatum TaxID=34168 RepID=A0ACC2DVH8_DIPCM|nr:hypothetical protein O6H91_04G026400 [Diphasiastrum complanatum]